MPNNDDIRWFKKTFGAFIEPELQDTPFTVDMVTGIGCQETGEIWPILRKKGLNVSEILELCVGDTIDGTSKYPRKAFPRTRAELVEHTNGQQMFNIARDALVEMAKYIPGYKSQVNNPDKICHGFGIFQYDLQHFKEEPDYFLAKRYAHFPTCLAKCIEELLASLNGIGWKNKKNLTDFEMACVGIAYNTGPGNFKPSKGLKQGYKSGDKYYGEMLFAYIQTAHALGVDESDSPDAPDADLVVGQHIPNIPERDAVGSAATKILHGSSAFAALISNTNPDVIFKDEEGTGADRMMTVKLSNRIDTLAQLVKTEWPGIRLRITEAWDENNEHGQNSVHYEARAADMTTSDIDGEKLRRLARLAVNAGFEWVFYENAFHVHASVSK